MGCTVPFVQTPVLSVKNNRLGDKIVLSLTPAILGMLIFKPQNEPWAWGRGRGSGEVRGHFPHLTKTFCLVSLGGDKVRVNWQPGFLALS